MIDSFSWGVITILLMLCLGLFLLLFFKPNRRIIVSALLSGAVLSLLTFVIEVFTGAIGLWGYNQSAIMVMGITITAPIYLFISGFNFSVFYDGFKMRFKMPEHYMQLFMPVYLLAVIIVSTSADVWGAQDYVGYWHFSLGWTPFHIAMVWSFLWLVCLGSFRFLKRRLPKSL